MRETPSHRTHRAMAAAPDPVPNLTLALLLAGALLTAGCIQDLASGGLLGEDPPQTTWDVTFSGCTVAEVTVHVDRGDLRRRLPLGYEPKDAGDALGLPQESGYANLTLRLLDCRDGTVDGREMQLPAAALVLTEIQDPEIQALEQGDGGAGPSEDVARHLYVLQVLTEDPRLLEALDAMSYATQRAKVVVDLQAGGPLAGGQATVTGDQDALYTARLGTGDPASPDPATRTYQRTPRALAVRTTNPDAGNASAGTGELRMANTTLMAEIAGSEGGIGPTLVLTGYDEEGAYRLVGGEVGEGG